jgi:CRISPR/Cas system CMR-associated protein Cmr1 (group 7 of RAMP superfamily)
MGGERATLALPGEGSLGTLTLLLRNGKPESFEGDSAAILDALRLWVTLGGIGSRTRRGVGAIGPKNREAARDLGLPTSPPELKDFLSHHCRRHSLDAALDGVFSLARTRKVFLGSSCGSGEAAQEVLLKALKEARQSKDPRWPEANAIRWKYDPVQAAKREKPERDKDRYPRMVLGLPIVFHFKDSKYPEPPDHHLYATTGSAKDRRKFDRYSSPIVLQPVRVWENGRVRYIPVAIFTDCLLPADARPLVVTKPDIKIEDVDPKDIVETFIPANEAETVLSRVEAVFEKSRDLYRLL